MTSSRPIAIALAASVFYAGVFVAAAQAEMHYVRVTLITGQQLTITVEVPPGTPVDQIQIPGLPAPIASIVDLGSTETTPTPTATRARGHGRSRRRRPPRRRTSPRDSGNNSSGTGKTKDPVDKTKNKTEEAVEDAVNRAGANTESLTGKVQEAKPEPAQDDAQPPAQNDPSYSLAEPGAARIGVPNFFIDKFRIPPFLLPIYQAAGTQYGIRWELLAAINEIETDYGRNTNVSSAGAQGWMQFMPASWEAYGVDGNQDGMMDPYNPVDAIFAAARYLKAAGADHDIRAAVFAYNHADWYVDSVLLRAQVIGGLPSNLVGSLTGLTEGRFPVAAKATYADEVSKKSLRSKRRNPTVAVESSANRRGITVFADAGSPVVAVSDSRVVKIGVSERLGKFVQVQDAYGNTYTYGRLAKVSELYAAPKPQKVDPAEVKRMLALPKPDAKPKVAASDTDRPAARAPRKELVEDAVGRGGAGHDGRRAARQGAPVRAPGARERLGRRRRPAGVPAHRSHRRRAHAGARDRPGARPDRHQAAQARRPGPRRHGARPHRQGVLGSSTRTCASRSARPAAALRGSTRSRSSTAGSCSSRPRSTAPRARTRSSARTPRRPRSARSC